MRNVNASKESHESIRKKHKNFNSGSEFYTNPRFRVVQIFACMLRAQRWNSAKRIYVLTQDALDMETILFGAQHLIQSHHNYPSTYSAALPCSRIISLLLLLWEILSIRKQTQFSLPSAFSPTVYVSFSFSLDMTYTEKCTLRDYDCG